MKMEPEEIVLLGVKNAIIAFERKTGRRLWQQTLPSSGFGDFVSVIADEACVYAHAGGEIFCVDLQSGELLWRDGLTGLGYGLATLAFPNGTSTAPPVIAQKIRQTTDSGHAAAGS